MPILFNSRIILHQKHELTEKKWVFLFVPWAFISKMIFLA